MPTMKVDKPMIKMVSKKVYLRPIMSPNRPKKMAPKGRTKNPAANPNKVTMNAALLSKPLKNCLAMMSAKAPNK